jgi:hypothetical protein
MCYFLGKVRDYNRKKQAVESVNIVIHATALKQVPATEYNLGKICENGFSYSNQNNEWFLTVNELRNLNNNHIKYFLGV